MSWLSLLWELLAQLLTLQKYEKIYVIKEKLNIKYVKKMTKTFVI